MALKEQAQRIGLRLVCHGHLLALAEKLGLYPHYSNRATLEYRMLLPPPVELLSHLYAMMSDVSTYQWFFAKDGLVGLHCFVSAELFIKRVYSK